MNGILAQNWQEKLYLALLNAIGVSLIYFTPALSHLFSFPVYYLEPMRIMMFIGLAFMNRKSVYFIALSLPFFSYLISAHPSIIKSGLIAFELVINAWLFYFLFERNGNKLQSAFFSLILSKLLYYSLKYLFIFATLLSAELISTPVYIQIFIAVALSIFLAATKKAESN